VGGYLLSLYAFSIFLDFVGLGDRFAAVAVLLPWLSFATCSISFDAVVPPFDFFTGVLTDNAVLLPWLSFATGSASFVAVVPPFDFFAVVLTDNAVLLPWLSFVTGSTSFGAVVPAFDFFAVVLTDNGAATGCPCLPRSTSRLARSSGLRFKISVHSVSTFSPPLSFFVVFFAASVLARFAAFFSVCPSPKSLTCRGLTDWRGTSDAPRGSRVIENAATGQKAKINAMPWTRVETVNFRELMIFLWTVGLAGRMIERLAYEGDAPHTVCEPNIVANPTLL
jgi:hypothetical protein